MGDDGLVDGFSVLDLAQRLSQAPQACVGVKRKPVVGDEPPPDSHGIKTHTLQIVIVPAPGRVGFHLAHQGFNPFRIGQPGC